jgi:ATP-dependent Clp protease adapter protein ClpS
MSNIVPENNPVNNPEIVTEELEDVSTILPARVILFNDNIHSFDDVICQLIKAINCSSERAEAYAWEVHTKGKACVYVGDIEKCLKVSSILEEIGLHTQIES